MKRLAFAASVLSLMLASPALAIPIAGNYLFATGDPYISGSFTSTGSELSAWSFSSDLLRQLFTLGMTQSWNSETDVDVASNLNNAERLITNNSTDLTDLSNSYFGQLIWNPDPSVLNAIFRIDGPQSDLPFGGPFPIVSFVPAQSVPDPDMIWPTVIGMIGLAGFVAWRQRGARLS